MKEDREDDEEREDRIDEEREVREDDEERENYEDRKGRKDDEESEDRENKTEGAETRKTCTREGELGDMDELTTQIYQRLPFSAITVFPISLKNIYIKKLCVEENMGKGKGAIA
ncbi:hypothetical protein Pmani_018140 [Petrolisthes manimaculis]|uniref:Uncharacterized protein n=1 Tax=Petrolisthes manimaculis TaxID=1843537 RepID=A0AAE1U560_9EUCA|nr:hypothetical protein Pmani_018140 [Petrolisthes manimaculis]